MEIYSKLLLKKILNIFGIKQAKRRIIFQKINKWSIRMALRKSKFGNLSVERLREIEPDISDQEESGKEVFNEYWEFKRRALQAFQCSLMLESLKNLSSPKLLTVVDIGDSRGTHMLYLKALAKDSFEINSISVNMDPRAIKKIREKGLKAIQCRAEELELKITVDLFVSFQMLEHLHNPALFLRNLTKERSNTKLIITVPYLKNSRVGLHHIRDRINKKIFSEEEHIFELSPEDWSLLFLHSGWKVLSSKIYYQYPQGWPFFSRILSWYWKNTDFEGFWGAVLEKDTTVSNLYQDW